MTDKCNQKDVQVVDLGIRLRRPLCEACRDAAGRFGMLERRKEVRQ